VANTVTDTRPAVQPDDHWQVDLLGPVSSNLCSGRARMVKLLFDVLALFYLQGYTVIPGGTVATSTDSE
jgi:hypothetical protein